jgi:hypothetical protein
MLRGVFGLFVAAVFLAGAATLDAQQVTGGVRGIVRDASGVLRNASVVLEHRDTGVARRTSTNDAGEFLFAALPPGEYALRAVMAGYQPAEHTGLQVRTTQVVTVDLALDVAGLTASTTVRATPANGAERSTASQHWTVGRDLLTTLPSAGRNAFLLAAVAPTFLAVGDPQFNRQQDQTNASRVSLGGSGVRASPYLIDGVPITDLSGRAVMLPTIESLEAVDVAVRAYDAEIGRSGGGAFSAAARSGTNVLRGTGFYQTRPTWGQALDYFNDAAGLSRADAGLNRAYYRLWGGGVGGPLVKNRTFFWSAVEGYRSGTTRSLQRLWPSLNQRTGDFSQTTIRGVPVRIFNPWCRAGISAKCPASGTGSMATGGEFVNAIIPRIHPAASAVGFNLASAWPTATNYGQPLQPNENNEPNAIATSLVVDEADMWTMKIDHKATDRWSLSGFYAYNNTDEPGALAMPQSHAYMDADYFSFRRRPHVFSLNDTHVLSDNTVLTLRFGWTTFKDQLAKTAFAPGLASLGFDAGFVGALHPDGRDTFPSIIFEEVSPVGFQGGTLRTWQGRYAINATLSTLWGRHALKAGADAREMGLATGTELLTSGLFTFNRLFSSSSSAPNSGHEIASLLLGAPSGGFAPVNRGEGRWTSKYVAAYVQDDWRVSSRVTLNAGARLEHEDGLREAGNRQTVAFDREAVSPLDALANKAGTLLEGRTLRGGLVYAGVDGAPERQGNLPALTVSPRVGAAFALSERTVLRGGYGLFMAPPQYTSDNRGQDGFTRSTGVTQSASDRDAPMATLDNPFPSGLLQPAGRSLGLLTGAGGSISFVDQNKRAARIHQYSVDLQRELPGHATLLLSYSGATGRDLDFGGTSNVPININQIDPALARQLFPAPGGGWDVEALRAQVPNPFFGVAAAGALGAAPTIAQGQLLRPFPQFLDVNMRESTAGGRRQYHAAIASLEKRFGASGWGGRFSYVWSRMRDNQFGEVNVYAVASPVPQNHHDLSAEYSVSHLDAPHRIVLAPVFRIPGPTGRRLGPWLNGWTASAIAELVSGPPLNAVMSPSTSSLNLGLVGGLQRPDEIGDPETPSSDADRVASALHPAARWFDAGAFADPGPGRFGSAPRTITDARYQFRKNLDLAFSKDVALPGGDSAQIRVEIINATNTPKFGGSGANAIDLSSFGRVTGQLGFSRVVQLSARYNF